MYSFIFLFQRNGANTYIVDRRITVTHRLQYITNVLSKRNIISTFEPYDYITHGTLFRKHDIRKIGIQRYHDCILRF